MAPTMTQLMTRIEAIIDAQSGWSILTGEEIRIDPAVLPAIELMSASKTRRTLDRDKRIVRYEFRWLVVATEVTHATSIAAQHQAIDACDTLGDTLADLFKTKSLLELNDNGLAFGTEPVTDSAPEIGPYKGITVASFIQTLPVIVLR